MGHITISETIEAPVATVFAYVDDHRNTVKYMQGLTEWKPTTGVTHGKGAQFEVAMKAGPSTLHSVVDITTWTENRAIGWKSNEGFRQTGKWAFRAKGQDATEVTFEMEYDLGGGIAGRLVGRAAEPVVRSNLQRSVQALKQQTERLGARAPAKPGAARSAPAKTAAKTAASKSPAKRPAKR